MFQSNEQILNSAAERLARGHPQAAARLLLAALSLPDQAAQAKTMLNGIAATGPMGCVLAERLRFGPPESWSGWLPGQQRRAAIKLWPQARTAPDLRPFLGFRHPGLAPLLGCAAQWGVWGWIDGPSLAQAARDGQPLDPRAILPPLGRTLDALEAAGLAHGDLSPANIILGADGPVLIDCGESCAGTPGFGTPDRAALAALAQWLDQRRVAI